MVMPEIAACTLLAGDRLNQIEATSAPCRDSEITSSLVAIAIAVDSKLIDSNADLLLFAQDIH
jgi:hypothetical protein